MSLNTFLEYISGLVSNVGLCVTWAWPPLVGWLRRVPCFHRRSSTRTTERGCMPSRCDVRLHRRSLNHPDLVWAQLQLLGLIWLHDGNGRQMAIGTALEVLGHQPFGVCGIGGA